MHIYLCAHQDDEFAFLHSIAHSVKTGHDPHILFLTNGDATGGSGSRRNAESINVLSSVGISQEKIDFIGGEYGFIDGCLYEFIDEAWRIILDKLADKASEITSIYMPAWEGGHQDHDALYVLGMALAKKCNVIDASWQTALYNGSGLPFGLYRVMSPLKDNGPVTYLPMALRERLQFLMLFWCYRSQIKAWLGLYPFVILDYIFKGTEKLQKVSWNRIFEPPHSGELLYQKRGYCESETILPVLQRFALSVERQLEETTNKITD
jgi:LmbE family N-acetylglucosaminyl deacetylase